jgi:CheY-like chemotaxis protein
MIDDKTPTFGFVYLPSKDRLYFTDENMDFINGTDAIALLRKMEQTKKIILPNFVSSTNEPYVEEKMEILKVYKIISKPINKNSLINLLEDLKLLKGIYLAAN